MARLSGQTGNKAVPRLVLRGPRVHEMFGIVVSMTRDAGIDLSGVSLPIAVVATVSSDSPADAATVSSDTPQDDEEEEKEDGKGGDNEEQRRAQIEQEVQEAAEEVAESEVDYSPESEGAQEQTDEEQEAKEDAMEAEEAEAQPQPKMLLERVASQLERLARDACSSPSVTEQTRQEVSHAFSIFPAASSTPVKVDFCTTCLGRGAPASDSIADQPGVGPAVPGHHEVPCGTLLWRPRQRPGVDGAEPLVPGGT